jgi:glycerol transport system ATP-binding protein
MASIELRGLWHSYKAEKKIGWFKRKEAAECSDENYCITDLSIKWEDGSANALLGPSGCGKTTLLNVISGLIRPTKGQVLLDGKDVTSLSPEERHIAQVFQFPVTYESMDVYQNLAFPLKNDGWASGKIESRVREIIGILDLGEIVHRSMAKLTPADKQKVSLGRGLVRPNTAAVLLDEPLTVIDPKQQWDLRRRLRQVQRQLKLTMIYVTHDQHEALTFADNITVMNLGKISQTGTPEELHANPANPFIGFFIGSPGMNLLDCTLKGDVLDFDGFALQSSQTLTAHISGAGGTCTLGIRPEAVEVSLEAKEGWAKFELITVENVAAYKVLTLEAGKRRIKSRVSENITVVEGSTAWVRFPEEHIKLFKNNVRIDG